MKISVIILAIAGIMLSCNSVKNINETTQLNRREKDSRGNEMLLGKCNRTALHEKPFSDWFEKNYRDYSPEQSAIPLLKELLKNKTIMLFLGTWCGDSRREVPRMLNILDAAGFQDKNLQMVMVSNQPDMYKQSPTHEEAGKNIIRVPTLIIYENEKEIGRIVEYPVKTLEQDLLSILKGIGYIPNYSQQSGKKD